MAKPADPLATYNKKRDFAKTAEPPGTVAPKRKPHARPCSWSRSTTPPGSITTFASSWTES